MVNAQLENAGKLQLQSMGMVKKYSYSSQKDKPDEGSWHEECGCFSWEEEQLQLYPSAAITSMKKVSRMVCWVENIQVNRT